MSTFQWFRFFRNGGHGLVASLVKAIRIRNLGHRVFLHPSHSAWS